MWNLDLVVGMSEATSKELEEENLKLRKELTQFKTYKYEAFIIHKYKKG